jgi:branched-chain amino acid transport system permease protein
VGGRQDRPDHPPGRRGGAGVPGRRPEGWLSRALNPNTIADGLLTGGFYALIALGLSLVFGVLRLVNLAHGEFVVGGAYLASILSARLGMDPLLTLPAVALAAAGVGFLLQRHLLTGLLLRGAEGPLVATFGLSIVAQAVFAAAFSYNPVSLRAPYAAAGVQLLGIRVRDMSLIAATAAVVLCAGSYLLLTRTRVGAALRAAAADPQTASLMGLNVRRVYALLFAAGAAVAAVGGVLVGLTFSVTPTTGPQYLVVAITVVVLGGIGNVWGTLLGGILIGLVQALGTQAFGGGYGVLAVYVVFLLVLTIRPAGLLGRRLG